MWYRIDFTKLAIQLLPPLLRGKFLASLIRVMVLPLCYLYMKFSALKDNADSHLCITGNVIYMEKALNDAFFLTSRQIYIETPKEDDTPPFHFISESQKADVIYRQSESTEYFLYRKGESKVLMNFTVMVPTFLCTSLTAKDNDKFNWQYLSVIRNIIKTYKPAGRTFGIELYDYE